jgi:2-polyprenyl-3-methyl-5-hydroxy-6-metoxy-1,4-benzoquinol methylase
LRESTTALSSSRRTIQFYEGYAREYSGIGTDRPSRDIAAALRRMVKTIDPGGMVLEIGSGPGIDADLVESLGATVRRTDPTQAFRDLQAERGKHVEPLNLLTDDLGGPYDAVLAMHVLIHIERAHTDRVLRKIWKALRPGGTFLVAMWEGTGETSGQYHMTYWSNVEFAARLTAAGFKVDWHRRQADGGGDTSLTFLARRLP